MKVFEAKNIGFCFGVKRAIEIAEKSVDNSKKVYTFGEIIHNPQAVKQLESKGIYAIKDIEKLTEGDWIIFPSHGVKLDILQKAKDMGLDCIDATCRFVKDAQDKAKQLYSEGYKVFIFGDPNHTEVLGIASGVKGSVIVNKDNIESVLNGMYLGKVGIVSQTTQQIKDYNQIISKLYAKAEDEVKVCYTICKATTLRQESTLDLAKKVKLMIVVGGHNSANTSRLAEICKGIGRETYHIETENELDERWFKGIDLVGVTAGASTPDWVINKVKQRIEEYGRAN